MAKLNKKGNLKGVIGNLVYREYKNQTIVQIKPGRVKQTIDSKIAAQEFGIASNAGLIIRHIGKLFYEYNDTNVSGRLNAELLKCLRQVDKEPGKRNMGDINPEPLIGFQFNLEAPFERVFKASLSASVEADGTIVVRQPSLEEEDIPYLATSVGYRAGTFLRLGLIGIDYTEETAQLLHQEERSLIAYNNDTFFQPFDQEWRCLKQLSKNLIVFLYCSLHYYKTDFLGRIKILSDKRYNPAGILLAFKVDEQMHTLNIQNTLGNQQYLPMQPAEEFYSLEKRKIEKIAEIKDKQKKK